MQRFSLPAATSLSPLVYRQLFFCRRIFRPRKCLMLSGRLQITETSMIRKWMVALLALAAVGLVQPTAAFARGGGGGGHGGGGGGHGGGFGGGGFHGGGVGGRCLHERGFPGV